MSIEAMKLALEALQNSKPSNADGMLDAEAMNELWHAHYAAINALRTAIQQEEAKTGVPVAWVVMNGLSKYQVCGAKAPADALCSEMQKRHDLSGSLAAFHVQPLYTHPAPGVPEDVARDAQRYRWLRRKACVIGKTTYCGEETGQPILDFVNLPDVTEVIRRDSATTLDAAIDAAMLAAAQAQKGQP